MAVSIDHNQNQMLPDHFKSTLKIIIQITSLINISGFRSKGQYLTALNESYIIQ
jgi:hypothetical protein